MVGPQRHCLYFKLNSWPVQHSLVSESHLLTKEGTQDQAVPLSRSPQNSPSAMRWRVSLGLFPPRTFDSHFIQPWQVPLVLDCTSHICTAFCLYACSFGIENFKLLHTHYFWWKLPLPGKLACITYKLLGILLLTIYINPKLEPAHTVYTFSPLWCALNKHHYLLVINMASRSRQTCILILIHNASFVTLGTLNFSFLIWTMWIIVPASQVICIIKIMCSIHKAWCLVYLVILL